MWFMRSIGLLLQKSSFLPWLPRLNAPQSFIADKGKEDEAMGRLMERTADGILVKEDRGENALKTLYQCSGMYITKSAWCMWALFIPTMY